MDEDNDLIHIYKDGNMDLEDSYENVMIELLFTDLYYYKDGTRMKITAYPWPELLTIEELKYFNEHIDGYENNIDIWLEEFIKAGDAILDHDTLNKNHKYDSKERWNIDEIEDKKNYDSFEEWWDSYEDSQDYYDEINFLQQMYWDDFIEEWGEGCEVLSKYMADGLQNYNGDGIDGRSIREGVESMFANLKGEVEEFEASIYCAEDFDYDELTEHFDDIFE